MDIMHIIQRWFVLLTVLFCVLLAVLFGLLQAGLI
jgi:hypothetical protein